LFDAFQRNGEICGLLREPSGRLKIAERLCKLSGADFEVEIELVDRETEDALHPQIWLNGHLLGIFQRS
jgi:hypothetical protein